MKTPTTPFRKRAEKVIRQAVKLRLFLIRNGNSKNGVKESHCSKVTEDIDLLRSDRQFAKYLLDNSVLIEQMMPGPHKKSKAHLIDLQTEAINYL